MFGFTLLGTGVSRPTPQRRLTAASVSIDGDRYLLDCPEGIQIALQRHGVGMQIDGVLTTGQHLENLLGVPGLLTTLDTLVEDNDQQPLADLTICVPAVGSDQGLSDARNRVSKFVGLSDHSGSVTVRPVTPGETVFETESYVIDAFRTKQSRGVSVGYRVYEPQRRGEFDRERAEEIGVPVGPKFGRLHEGESVELDDGTVVDPEEVVGDPRPGRSFAYTGATEHYPELSDQIKGTDVLLCDCGLTAEDYNEQHVDNHMSAYQAGGVAEAAEASVLFPTHIRGRYGPNPVRLEPDLRQSFDGMHMLSQDGMRFSIQTRGTDQRATDRSDVISKIS